MNNLLTVVVCGTKVEGWVRRIEGFRDGLLLTGTEIVDESPLKSFLTVYQYILHVLFLV